MKLHNTLTRKTEKLNPLQIGKIKMYACGLTVYSQPHIGNWVAYLYWDILVRTLRASGYNVDHVQNITDVGHLTSDEDAGEDKMSVGALREGKTAWQVAEKYSKIAEDEAFNLLGLLKPSDMPRATNYIDEQIAFIQELESKGLVYKLNDGVYFDTSKFKDYGKLARLDIAGLQFGARVKDTGKKNPTDFALWKFSNPGQKRDMEWPSPWGVGFPGWHIECSAMARAILGDQIDIHMGGIDHIPVHHTNEIAQTESLTNKKFSRIWVHANHLKVNGTKMAKSLGNIVTLNDIQNNGFLVDAFKILVFGKHYQTEGNFTWDILKQAQNRLNNWLEAVDLAWQDVSIGRKTSSLSILGDLQNNLDSTTALSKIDDYFDQAKNQKISSQDIINATKEIKTLLGIDLMQHSKDLDDRAKLLINERAILRKNKKFVEADVIRDNLHQIGVKIRDTDHLQFWSRLR